MSTEKFKIGIIGTGGRGIGGFGKMLAKRDDAYVAAMADTNRQRREGAAKVLESDANLYASAEEMFSAEALDGVIITTPDCMHEEHALAAMAAGVHVLVDKPLATTVAGCRRVIEAAQAASRTVTVGFNLRHYGVTKKIKELIDNGDIGELMLLENREFYDGGRTYMARWNRLKEFSGGLWVHKGCHDFDIFNWFNSKGMPLRVSAFGGVNALRADKVPFTVEDGKPIGPNCSACAYLDTCADASAVGDEMFNAETAEEDGYLKDLCIYTSEKDTHDNGIALIEYDNNARASHLECFVCNFTDRLYTVVGDRGTIIASLSEPDKVVLRPRWGEDREIEVPRLAEGGHGGSDPNLLADFIETIRTGQSLSATVWDGIRAVAVSEAAEISWRENRTVAISELLDLDDPLLASLQG